MANPTNPLQVAAISIVRLSKTLDNLTAANALLDRLEALVSSTRARRVPEVAVSNIVIAMESLPDGSGVPVRAAAVTGMNNYNTRITFRPKQGFHCTCPDLQDHRRACKHVAALATECRKRFWSVMSLIESDAERFSIQLVDLESAANDLASRSAGALKKSLKSLET